MKKGLLLSLGIVLSGVLLFVGIFFFSQDDVEATPSQVSADTSSFENNFYDYLAESLQEVFVSSGSGSSPQLTQKIEQLTDEGITMIDEFIAHEEKEGRSLNEADLNRLTQLRFYVYSSVAIDEEKTRATLSSLPNNPNKLSLLYVYIETFTKADTRQISQSDFEAFIQKQSSWAQTWDEKYLDKVVTLQFKADPIGKPFPNHLAKYNDIEGQSLDLNRFRGKYTLVDFWATWCLPCIVELPYLQEAYQNYHDKGFEIISISIDQDEEAFRNFVSERNLAWIQYYDGEGFLGGLVGDYGVTGIPTLYLIDREGKTISVNMRGEELIQILKTRLGT